MGDDYRDVCLTKNPHKASYITKLLQISEGVSSEWQEDGHHIWESCETDRKATRKESGGQKQLEEEGWGPGGAT